MPSNENSMFLLIVFWKNGHFSLFEQYFFTGCQSISINWIFYFCNSCWTIFDFYLMYSYLLLKQTLLAELRLISLSLISYRSEWNHRKLARLLWHVLYCTTFLFCGMSLLKMPMKTLTSHHWMHTKVQWTDEGSGITLPTHTSTVRRNIFRTYFIQKQITDQIF